MHVSEDGTEIHLRHYDCAKDFLGAKYFLARRWVFMVNMRAYTTLRAASHSMHVSVAPCRIP